MNNDFWEEWVNNELNNYNNEYNLKIEDIYFNVGSLISTNMIRLSFDLKFIINCLAHTIGSKYLKDVTYIEF